MGVSEKRKVRQFIQRAGVAMLMTIDEQGGHAGRPMLPLLLDDDPHIYFLTHQSSRKVAQLAIQPRIGLTITGAHCYVVVAGRANVLRDRAIIDQLWHPTYRAWFPRGKDDREAVALQVVVERINYWEPPRSRVVRLGQAVWAFVTRRRVDTPMKTIDGL